MSDCERRSECSDDSSDGGSSLDEPPPARRADMPVGSLEAFAARQKEMMMRGRCPGPISIQLAPAAPATPMVTPRLHRPPVATAEATAVTASPPPSAAESAEGQGANKQGQLHRLNIFVLVRILFHYLDKVDKKLLLQAKQVLKECDKQKKAGNPEFQQLSDAIPPRIRACVGDHHWHKALAIQRQFLKSKQKETRQATSAPPAKNIPATARPQHQRSEIVARKFAQAGVLATDEVGQPLAAVPASQSEHRPSLRHHTGVRRASRRHVDDVGSGGATTAESDNESDEDEADDDDGTHATSHKHRRSPVCSGEQNSAPLSAEDKRSAGERTKSSERMVDVAPPPPSAAAAAPAPKHKRVASAPTGASGGAGILAGGVHRRESSGRQDSLMVDQPALTTVASADSSEERSSATPDRAVVDAAAARVPAGRRNEYRGQEQQAAPQRRRREDGPPPGRPPPPAAATPPPPPLPPTPFGLQAASNFGSGERLTEAALARQQQRQQQQQQRASPSLDQFSLTREAKPFSPSGFTLFSYGAPPVVSGGSTPPVPSQPLLGRGASGIGAETGTQPSGSNGRASVPMDTRSREDSLACSSESSEEAAVVDVEEDEVDDGTMLRSARVRG